MLQIGADPNTRASDGLTPLWMALINNDSEIVRLLVMGGADVNAPEPRNGDTPLLGALSTDKTEIAQLLIDSGANPDIPNNKGITARQVRNFKVMKAGGWDPSKPNLGSAFFDNLGRMSEEGLIAFFNLLPRMIEIRVKSGEIDPQRAAQLNSLLREFEQAMSLPLQIRSTRMREIREKLVAIMRPQGRR